MRALALVAFFALQLSIFTCGFGIHVHAMDSDAGYVAGHLHDNHNSHKKGSTDRGCYVHASHTFDAFDIEYVENISSAPTVQYHVLSESNLKKIPFLIEHPPKFYRS